jgi:hypothetical protein
VTDRDVGAWGDGGAVVKDQRDMRKVASVLAKAGRFSVFEATDNPVIAKTMDKLQASGWFEFDNGPGFPWTKVTLTEAGKTALGVKT